MEGRNWCKKIWLYVKVTQKRKTTIELSEEQYFFLKEKALKWQKRNHSASIVSIIRELIEKVETNRLP